MSGLGDEKSWVRVVPAGFGLFLDHFSYFFKKGEGVSAVLLAIFLRRNGTDSPFLITKLQNYASSVSHWF